MDNIGVYMEQVARHYWGEPTRIRGRTMRFGKKGGREINKDKGTWFDFEINEGGGVIDLVRLMEGAQIGGIGKVLQRKFGIPSTQQEKIKPREYLSKVYDYFDENGELQYQVLRYEPRRFLQRRPDGDGWVYKMDGVEPLPYRLHEIIARPDDPVFIVEGEKCADALAKQGVLATTSHGGAGKWREPLNKWFAGRRVFVLPDNDEPGKRHADGVITHLLPIAKEIRRVELPGLPPKGDIVDWINAGQDLDTLREFCKRAPVIETAPEKKPENSEQNHSHIYEMSEGNSRSGITVDAEPDVFRVLAMADLLALPPPDWLIDGVCTRTSFGVLYGPPGAGKSFAAIDMAMSVATGQAWHGRGVAQAATLYIAAEGGGGLGKRIKALQAARRGAWRGPHPLYVIDQAVRFADAGDVEALLATIDTIDQRFGLVIVDTVARAMVGSDENDAQAMGEFVEACAAVQRHIGGALIGIHHSGKDVARGLRGSSALLGAADHVIRATQEDGILKLECEKQKDAEPMPPVSFRMRHAALIGDTSLVLERIEPSDQRGDVASGGGRALTPSQQIALTALDNATVACGKTRVPKSAWEAHHLAMAGDFTPSTRRSARAALLARGLVMVAGGEAWRL